MTLTPPEFLALMLVITGAAAVAQLVLRQRRVAQLRALADQWRMHFSATDRFQLAPRVAPRLPVPGAAAVRVSDLLYGIERENYRYVFCTEYTTGVLRTKTGIRRVATFAEPRDGSGAPRCAPLVFAPEALTLVEQYRHLLRECEEVRPRANEQ
jgi:hypothetical protein